MFFEKLLPREGNFFEMFEAHALTIVAAADALARLLHGGTAAEDHSDFIVSLVGLDARCVGRHDRLTVRDRPAHCAGTLSAGENPHEPDGRSAHGCAVLVSANIDGPGPLAERHPAERH